MQHSNPKERRVRGRLRGRFARFARGERAATASEYAAIFAVLLLALLVSISVVGRHLGHAVRAADTHITQSAGGGTSSGGTDGGGPASAKSGGPGAKDRDGGAFGGFGAASPKSPGKRDDRH